MQYFKIDPENPDLEIVKEAVSVLNEGGIIVYPTDTLYGLGVDMTNSEAVHKLYLIKQRNPNLPVSLMVHSVDQIEDIAGILPTGTHSFLLKLFPGKITAIVKNRKQGKKELYFHFSREKKLGFRIPGQNLCQALAKGLNRPISTTSANLSGKENAKPAGIRP